MSGPHLDHATKDGRKWQWSAGCWREWSDVQANWLPSLPPPADAEFFNYREWILGGRA
jgi:hypothetical protein